MHRIGACALMTAASLGVALLGSPQQTSPVAKLSRIRAALGGEAALSGIRTLRIRTSSESRLVGPASQGNKLGATQVTRTELLIMFPDHFLTVSRSAFLEGPPRQDISDEVFGAPSRWGFAGPRQIGRGSEIKERLLYLALGLLLRLDTAIPLTPVDLAQNGIRFRTSSGAEVFLDVDPQTERPLGVRAYVELLTPTGVPTGKWAWKSFSMEDYRPVGGLTLAHRFVERIGDRPNPLTQTIESYQINPKLTASDFQN